MLDIRALHQHAHECIPRKPGFNASAVCRTWSSMPAWWKSTKHAFVLGGNTAELPLMFSAPTLSWDLQASAVLGTALLLGCFTGAQVRNWQLSQTLVHLPGPSAEKAARAGSICLNLPYICLELLLRRSSKSGVMALPFRSPLDILSHSRAFTLCLPRFIPSSWLLLLYIFFPFLVWPT